MHARLQKDNYIKMKRFGAIILSTAIAATMIAGCNQKITENTTAGTNVTNQTVSGQAAETSAAYPEPQEPQSFEELYATQLTSFLDHQYYFDGEPIPKPEANFYFINAFLDLSGYASMGYYPATTLGYIDLAAEYYGDEYATYGDYFVKYAENSIESTFILAARAKAENVTLSEDTLKAIDEMMKNIESEKAANTDMTLDEYLQFYYGPGNDEATFRKNLERYYLADAYSKVYCENYPFTDEEKNVPNVRYALFYAPETAEQSVKDQALAAATAMKDSCKTVDDLKGLAESGQEAGTVYDQGDISVSRGQTVSNFEAWVYEEGRTTGDLDVIYAPEYGYFVVGYLGWQEQSADVLDQLAMQYLSKELIDEVNEGKHGFHTDDPFLPAPAGPTPTTVPDMAVPSEGVTFDPNSTAATEPGGSIGGQTSNTDVIIAVFFTLAGVAIIAVIGILIYSAVKNNNKSGSAPSGKPSKKQYDDDDDENDEKDDKEEKEVKEVKPRSSKKNSKTEAEDDEEEIIEHSEEDDDEE